MFFYGTLRHVPLLEIVLGRRFSEGQLVAGFLPEFTCFAVQEGPFPSLVASAQGRAEGVVVSGLSDDDIARLDYYEGGFDYDLIDVTLEDGTVAQVYVCAPDRWTTGAKWDFTGWCSDWGEMSCFAATEVMEHFGHRTRDEVAAMFPQIRARAWSKVLGGRTAAGQDVFDGQVEILEKRRAYTGFFAVDEVSLRHERFDGGKSPVLERSYFVAGDASLVLPYDPVRDRVLLVEQMRMGPLGRGDTEIWQLEPVAGRIDPGETPEMAAFREAREETSLTLTSLETVAKGYATPGESTCYFHMFVGVTDLPDEIAGVGGLETEHENIRSRLISFNDFMAMAERQALANTPTALMAYWLAHHRSRLRS
ncbi:tellurium resistance protein [Sulfitobacter donghicola DSW-25 = KCTC 12864 = JCM 14565]|uniref:Putative gamma-glutamylcyclotransferase n=1 Tax=Sulfitobacter donghicola DSW-25 = KCTC 12864 = JCM 14565 TaxID=1300350 RepID=A0A073IEN5_9RHOB|nr:tellurium resistance protein [Sulfitobacter donghicola DSW-25 = KCTC 12864 = JCM 14565]